jgi:CrcB protein
VFGLQSVEHFYPGPQRCPHLVGLASYFAEVMGLYFAIAIGSALGGVARFWCSGIVARLIGETFPWGTLIINVIGSFIIGFFATLTGPDGRIFVGSTARQFVMVGICGGYTTFSSFSLQTLNLMNDGEWFQAGANIACRLCCASSRCGQAMPSPSSLCDEIGMIRTRTLTGQLSQGHGGILAHDCAGR